ncbi:MAG: MFS transporter [Thermoplasmata archaeon]|nr:MFS transporter [Thermoplasmata archaeon]
MDRNLRYLGVGAGVRALGLSLLGPFFSLYLRNILHIGYTTIAVATIAISVVPLFVVAFGGFLTDRFGRRGPFLLAIAGEGGTMLGVAALMQAGSFVGVVAGLGILGIVGTAGGPALSAYVADFSVGSERTVAFTWVRIGHNAGFAGGVFAGGALIGFLGFVPVAVLAGVTTLLGVVFLLVTLDPSPYDRVLRDGGNAASGMPPVVRPGTMRQSLRILAHDRVFVAFCVVSSLGGMMEVQWGFAMPLYVHQDLRLSYAIIGAGYALNGLIVVFGQTLTTQLLLGHRHTTAAALSTLLYAASFLLLGVAGEFSIAPVTLFFVYVTILTVGENVGAVPGQTLPSNMAAPGEVGAYNGAYQTIAGVGPLVGILIGGFLLTTVSSPLLLWSLLIAPAVPAGLGFLAVGRKVGSTANRI